MAVPDINYLMEMWAFSKAQDNNVGPFDSYDHMYTTINATTFGDAPWKSFVGSWSGEVGPKSPSWQSAEYEVWYHDPDTVLKNLLDNSDFDGQFDYVPYVEAGKDGKQRWNNFMSRNFAWRYTVSQEYLLIFYDYYLQKLYRVTFMRLMQAQRVQCTAPLLPVLTRQQSLLPPAMSSTIHYTFH